MPMNYFYFQIEKFLHLFGDAQPQHPHLPCSFPTRVEINQLSMAFLMSYTKPASEPGTIDTRSILAIASPIKLMKAWQAARSACCSFRKILLIQNLDGPPKRQTTFFKN